MMLYKVQKKDIPLAGKVLVDAFRDDPLWNKIFEGEADLEKRFHAMAEASVRHGLAYGEVYAPSVNLEGVIAWAPGKHADMNIWQIIRSGNIGPVMGMGMKALRRMGTSMKVVPDDRHRHMGDSEYLYLTIIGVAPELQGKGLGRQLLNAVTEEADRKKLPLYLDVQREENVGMYEHFGCRVIDKIKLPVFNIPIWEMVRYPQV